MDSSLIYIIAFCVILFIAMYIYEKKRTAALALVAKKLNFSFSKKGRYQTEVRHKGFQLFSIGDRKKIQNEMWGTYGGLNIEVFGYQYTVPNGKSSTTTKQTVVSIYCNGTKFPTFMLRPENTFDKIEQVFNSQDIDFESFPKFSSRYLLKGNNEANIRQLFTSKVLSFFEGNQGLCVEAKNNTLIFYKVAKRCKPDDIEEHVEKGLRVHQLFH